MPSRFQGGYSSEYHYYAASRRMTMEKAISAAEANRKFSQLLQGVRQGRSYVVTSHGKPVAKISPVDESEKTRVSARETLLARLRRQPVVKAGALDERGTLRGCTVRVALDTNVLAYAEGVNGPSMKTLALELGGQSAPSLRSPACTNTRRTLSGSRPQGWPFASQRPLCNSQLARCLFSL